MTALSDLLPASREPDSAVTLRRESAKEPTSRVIGWAEFERDVSSLVERIESEPEGGWIVLSDDAYVFAVGLFGLWHSGRHAILPPNEQSGTLSLLEQRAAGVLSDRPSWDGTKEPVPPLESASASTRPTLARPLQKLDRNAPAVEIYTSGTTQKERSVTKCVRHLEDEVLGLQAIWDPLVGSSLVFSTVPHRHVYGLLFGVLWPLAAERCFYSRHILHVDELVPRMLEAESSVLASSPTTLKHLARHPDTEALRGKCGAVFSSGGPLATESAHAIARRLGRPPIEVLGSTETGGIAWRKQDPIGGDDRWTPFDAVDISREADTGVLRVHSPFVSTPGAANGFSTGDRIEVSHDGRFVLKGRSDQLIKIGEKRLDLDEMSGALQSHPWVEDVALVPLSRSAGMRIAAAVVPSGVGIEALEAGGRRPFGRELRRSLAESFDPVTHPRYWRIVSVIPMNAQGKVDREAIAKLFGQASPAAASVDRAEVLGELAGRDFAERSCRVPDDLSCFAGHFPGAPVVPAVLQVDWAIDLAAQIVGRTPRIAEIESLKLRAPLGPGQRFRLRVTLTRSNQLDFEISDDRATHASGRFRLEDAEPEP